MLRSLLVWLVMVPATLGFGTLSVLSSLVDRRGKLAHACMVAWARLGLRVAGTTVRVAGLEHVGREAPQIFAANHQSLVDIMALAAHLPVQFGFVAKAELFKIPFLGWHMRRAGYIPIVRENPRLAARTLLEAADQVRAGTNILIFPEGTRSPDGTLLPFKVGGFLLAAKAGVPIVPVGIAGTRDVVPKKSLRVRECACALVIGAPIPTAGIKGEARAELMNQVREAIAVCMARAEKLTVSDG
jgi:1-acyl-sn-glycerol-3-phosphate acyltransferase